MFGDSVGDAAGSLRYLFPEPEMLPRAPLWVSEDFKRENNHERRRNHAVMQCMLVGLGRVGLMPASTFFAVE